MTSSVLPLAGIRIISLALNLPGPAALMRLRAMGAQCTKVQGPMGDPMQHYSPAAYVHLHEGVDCLSIDLKTSAGQANLNALLARSDVLLTSFRPSALHKLGLDWASLHTAHPSLAMVSIIGAANDRAEEPGHDLTYMAEQGLVDSNELPATLFADMAGSLVAVEVVLAAVLQLKLNHCATHQTIALADAAAYLALPRTWGISLPTGVVGGAHAGYNIYPCQDGRIAVAALEPHFASALGTLAGLTHTDYNSMIQPPAGLALGHFFAQHTCAQISAIAMAHDIPLFAMPD